MARITFYTNPDNDDFKHSWLLENTGAMEDHAGFAEQIARSVASRYITGGIYSRVVLSFRDESESAGFQSWKEIQSRYTHHG